MLGIFIVMYFIMYLTALNGVSLGALSRPIIFSMPFFPLLGILAGTRIGMVKAIITFIKGRTEAPYAFLVNESHKELWQQINNDID